MRDSPDIEGGLPLQRPLGREGAAFWRALAWDITRHAGAVDVTATYSKKRNSDVAVTPGLEPHIGEYWASL